MKKLILKCFKLAEKYFLQILTLLMSFFSKGIENGTYCASCSVNNKYIIHTHTHNIPTYLLNVNIHCRSQDVCSPRLEYCFVFVLI